MAQNIEKVEQALIQAVNDISDKVEVANNLAQIYKQKWQDKNISIRKILSQSELTALLSWLADLNTLATHSVVNQARARNMKSHGTGALG